jgi:Protein of unknown function (DUF2442)
MTFTELGDDTSGVEYLGFEEDAVLFKVDGESFRLTFAEFPWFVDASVEDLRAVERPSHSHLSWPALDIDLSLDSLRHPERYPLISRVR